MNTTLLSPAPRQSITEPLPMAAPFETAHLVGIGGSGMKSLAELLGDLGCRVTGSDVQTRSAAVRDLRRRGMRVDSGHLGRFSEMDVEALIYSPAIGRDNAERQRAAQLGIPQFSLPQVLGWLMEDREGISVAGTHGKTTTTAMVAWILRYAYLSPSAFVGGAMRHLKRGGWSGRGDYFVVESCEYQRNFLHLEPQHAVITRIEPDHFETYPDRSALLNAFARFAQKVPPGGVLIASGDCPHTLDAVHLADVPCETFGASPQSNWWFDDVRQFMDGTRFRVFRDADFVTEITLPLFGRHNVLNALAAVALCTNLNVPPAMVRDALGEFPGVTRRFELVGSWRGATVIDDYAHHPTAVEATLETARDVYGRRRLWCVFQPHQSRRVERLMDDFAESFAPADRVLITPAFSARETSATNGGRLSNPSAKPNETPTDGRLEKPSCSTAAERCSRELVRRSRDRGIDCRFCPSLDRILPTLEDEARPGDVVLLMGAGDIERIRHELARRISRHHPH